MKCTFKSKAAILLAWKSLKTSTAEHIAKKKRLWHVWFVSCQKKKKHTFIFPGLNSNQFIFAGAKLSIWPCCSKAAGAEETKHTPESTYKHKALTFYSKKETGAKSLITSGTYKTFLRRLILFPAPLLLWQTDVCVAAPSVCRPYSSSLAEFVSHTQTHPSELYAFSTTSLPPSTHDVDTPPLTPTPSQKTGLSCRRRQKKTPTVATEAYI